MYSSFNVTTREYTTRARGFHSVEKTGSIGSSVLQRSKEREGINIPFCVYQLLTLITPRWVSECAVVHVPFLYTLAFVSIFVPCSDRQVRVYTCRYT